jgi:adenylate cyclase
MSTPPSDSSALPRETISQLRHQLRIPLFQIISYADLLAEDTSHSLGESTTSDLSKVVSICDHALRDISDFPVSDNVDNQVTVLSQTLADTGNDILHLARRIRESLGESNQISLSDAQNLFAGAHALVEAAGQIRLEDLRYSSHDSTIERFRSLTPAETTNQGSSGGLLLVIDDNEANRDILSRRLLRDGYEVMLAESGRQGLTMARRYNFDLVLLDIMMPELDGFAVLRELKTDVRYRTVPVVMISAIDETESVVKCLEIGADDYLPKPFNRTILRARIAALLERKRLRDGELKKNEELAKALAEVSQQRQKTEELLLNILPASVAQELQIEGSVQPMYFEDVTIVFADFVGFTRSTERLAADELVRLLHEYFSAFDAIMRCYGLEKLKTIGDCYMFVGGLPLRTPSHPVDAVLAAFEMEHATRIISARSQSDWKLRIGIHTGPVIAGIVGLYKFAFDIWGEAVNFSSRVETSGAPGRINLSRNTYLRVKDFFSCESRGTIPTKEGREVEMYFANGIAPSLSGFLSTKTNAFADRYRSYFRKDLGAFPTCFAGEDPLIA